MLRFFLNKKNIQKLLTLSLSFQYVYDIEKMSRRTFHTCGAGLQCLFETLIETYLRDFYLYSVALAKEYCILIEN